MQLSAAKWSTFDKSDGRGISVWPVESSKLNSFCFDFNGSDAGRTGSFVRDLSKYFEICKGYELGLFEEDEIGRLLLSRLSASSSEDLFLLAWARLHV
jgi:hypothetical protein